MIEVTKNKNSLEIKGHSDTSICTTVSVINNIIIKLLSATNTLEKYNISNGYTLIVAKDNTLIDFFYYEIFSELQSMYCNSIKIKEI